MAAVVVPWRPGCPHREAAWQWVSNQYEQAGYEVVEGHCPPGPWVKALAVQDGIDKTDADRLVVADADVWCRQLPEVLARTEDRPVVIPHGNVMRLSPEGTHQFQAREKHPDTIEEHRGMAGGGIVILQRQVWNRVPMDPRFAGWGQEDQSWAAALAMVTGKITRFSHRLWHLWHPPEPRLNRATGSEPNRALEQRYANADEHAMQALLTEAREALRGSPCPSS